MPERVVSPSGRGFLLLDAHPTGCFESVARMRAEIEQVRDLPGRGPVALVIGSSAGYGLAMTVAGPGPATACTASASPSSGRRGGAPGPPAGTARSPPPRSPLAGSDFTFVNADAFADTTKAEVLDLIEKRFGGLDYLVYSVAAPRRTDPRTGLTYQSVIKPLGPAHTTKTLDFDSDGTPILREVTVQPAD